MKLSEAEVPLRAALDRLLMRPTSQMPYVVIESPLGYVQFFGSATEKLTLRRPNEALHYTCAPSVGAQVAITVLRDDYGATDDTELTLCESEGVPIDEAIRTGRQDEVVHVRRPKRSRRKHYLRR